MKMMMGSLTLMVLLLVQTPGSCQNTVEASGILELEYDRLVADLHRSHTLLSEALAAARARNDTAALAEAHSRLSTVTYLKGQLDSATHHRLITVDIHRRTGDRASLGLALCEMGHMMKRRDLQQAFSYYQQGLAYLAPFDLPAEKARAYDNYGVLHEMNGTMDSAMHFYGHALQLKQVLNDSLGMPYSLNKIATVLMARGDLEEALGQLDLAQKIREAIDDPMGMADQQLYYGDLFEAWKRYPQAIRHFEQGLQLSKELNVTYLQQYANEHLASCYEALGDHAAALAATRRAIALKDSILNEKNSRTIIELEQRYRVAEKDREIAVLAERDAQRKLQLWLVTGLLAIALILGTLVHQWRQRRIRAEKDAAMIREREQGLQAMYEATEKERARLARELHDGVGQQLGGIKHRLEHLGRKLPLNGTAPLFQDVISIVDETSHEVRELAHQMMPKALLRLGMVPAMEEMFQRSVAGTEIYCSFEHHGMEVDIPQNIATGLYRIAQELMNNILKHASATEVEVQLIRHKDRIVLMVHDDGVGVDPNGKKGIGLMSISDRVRGLGGVFNLESVAGGGTTATVRLPLHTVVPSR